MGGKKKSFPCPSVFEPSDGIFGRFADFRERIADQRFQRFDRTPVPQSSENNSGTDPYLHFLIRKKVNDRHHRLGIPNLPECVKGCCTDGRFGIFQCLDKVRDRGRVTDTAECLGNLTPDQRVSIAKGTGKGRKCRQGTGLPEFPCSSPPFGYAAGLQHSNERGNIIHT
jgi:hypothetical protein